MKISFLYLVVFLLLIYSDVVSQNWPKEIKAKSGALITIYQPQTESMKGDKISGRAAFSAQEKPTDELLFGVFWYTSTMVTNRDTRTATLESIVIKDIKLPGIEDTSKISKLRKLLEIEIPKWELTSSMDDIIATIEQEQEFMSDELKHDAPLIYYKTEPTTLVLMDGEPRLQDDKDLKLKRVINTPFLIVENTDDKKYYLYGGQCWYASSSLKEGYQPITSLPAKIAMIDTQLKKENEGSKPVATTPPPALLISTTPAEIIQSKGVATFASITGTNLLYVSNSDNDIFKNINDQNYYILLSGRWYTSPKLDGSWTYVASDKLPEDFAKIPKGSDKDNVLSSVAGTQESKDALLDAQVPQTAKVDRKTAACTVTYDGEPKFEKIEGTSMELAMNTSSTVLKSDNKFYCVENGVWFIAYSATGPWSASDERPKDVDKIPASSPAYNVKYVYIYESTPEVVYVGYTPGYMGCYAYGPSVVYGTGYYYNPWYGPYYYPRPATYGFSMHYNPWTGWSMGFHYSVGFFSVGVYGHPGYWGPPMYRPPYHPPYRGGMYGGRGPTYIHNGDININRDRSNNIYNRRNDVSTRDVNRDSNRPSTMDKNRQPSQRPATQPGVSQGPVNRKNNDVYSGKDGNVYKRNESGNWDQRSGNGWKQTQQPSSIDRDYQNRQRSSQQNSNFQQMNRGGNMGGSYRGGGGRRK